MSHAVRRAVVLSAVVWLCGRARAADPPAWSYPHTVGQLTFPADEGRHSPSEWPMTLIEWYAHYSHLTAADGTRYLFFATFVTFDPIEAFLGGKFPHLIGTLVDVTHAKTWHHRDLTPLKSFSAGHADTETAAGDFFRWLGDDQPFCYALRVGWKDDQVEVRLDEQLRALKPPLAVNGTGYIKLPKGDSGYYSQTRLAATGTLTLNGVTQPITGVHWIDRQWLGLSCAANLGYTYEWWAIQLDNNQEAILFRIWETKTNTVAMSVLELVRADGGREKVDEFTLTDLTPGWSLKAPSVGWDLKLLPACAGQGTWQSCDVSGTIHGQPVTGLATAELARDIMREYMKVIVPGR